MAANWLMAFSRFSPLSPLQNTIPDNPGICGMTSDNIDIANVT